MVELYKLAGKGNVPKLIFPSTTVVGEFTSGDSLVEIIKNRLSNKRAATGHLRVAADSRPARIDSLSSC
jgi:hypothetical protein